jgi:hypothetical protein
VSLTDVGLTGLTEQSCFDDGRRAATTDTTGLGRNDAIRSDKIRSPATIDDSGGSSAGRNEHNSWQ